jgi:hypothetical protein
MFVRMIDNIMTESVPDFAWFMFGSPPSQENGIFHEYKWLLYLLCKWLFLQIDDIFVSLLQNRR